MAQQHKLFVGGLPPDVTNDDLQMVFSTYGGCTDCHIMQGRSTSGQACAFVVFDTSDAAFSAINALNGVYSIREGTPPISVSMARVGGGGGKGGGKEKGKEKGKGWGKTGGAGLNAVAPPSSLMGQYGARSQTWGDDGGYGGHQAGGGAFNPPPPPANKHQQGGTKLFIGNLPQDIQQEAIQMVFGHYGTVTNVHIMQGKSRSGQACAFVEYGKPEEAETAVLTLHEKYEIRPGEGNILVKFASSQGGPRSGPY